MKNLMKVFLYITLSGLFVFSCQQNDEFLSEDPKTDNKGEIGSEEKNAAGKESDKSMTFTYGGEAYASKFSLEDQSYTFQDEKVQAVFDEIMQLPELCTYVNEKGIIEYYDNYKEFEKNEKPQLRAIGDRETTWARLLIYDETCLMGRAVSFYIDSLTNSIEIPDLDGSYDDKKLNMKNMISSFEIRTFYDSLNGAPPSEKHGDFTTVVFFENLNYEGRSRVWKGNAYHVHHYEPGLEYYKWGGVDSPSIEKNISSLIFKFTNN